MIDLFTDLVFKIFPSLLFKQLFNRLDLFDIPLAAQKANKQLTHHWFSRIDLDKKYSIILKADMKRKILFIGAYRNFTCIKTKKNSWLSDKEFQQFILDQLFDFKLELQKEVYPHYAFYPPF